MQARHGISLFLLFLSLGTAHRAWAYPEYRVTVVAPANSSATDINEDGVVVGNYPFSTTSVHAFLNRGKGLVDLGALGGTASNAVAINDKCQVLGHWFTSAGQQRGFIYYRGTARDIGVNAGFLTTYSDINNDGYITAYGAVPDSFAGPHGFLRSPGGTFRDIGSLPFDNPMTFAYALNNHKQITGASGPLLFPDQPLRAFNWSRGVFRDLGDFGTEPNAGRAINDRGESTGYAALVTGFRDQHAFLYSGGRLSDIDGRPGSEDSSSEGTGINNHGHVVGNSNHLSGFVYRGRRMQSLNALIDPARGWDIRFPQAINDAGQIAATAFRSGVQYAVRLDLIRPLALKAEDLELEAKAATEAELKADADAQAREVVQPVKQ